MRALVTGAAGFIGSHICARLLKDKHQVIGMDNFLTGSDHNIAPFKKLEKFSFINHDVSKFIEVPGKLDYVLHLASPASPIDYIRYPIQTLKVGSLGTHNALGLAKSKGASFLLASTSEVYGDPLVNPQKEEYWGNVNCIGPRGVYDEAKRFAEALVMAYHRTHKMDTHIARIFNTYGPRMRINDGRAIPAFLEQVLENKDLTVFGEGRQTRSFCYISDLIEGLVILMNSHYPEPLNLGNPHEMSILELAKKIISLTKSQSKIVFKPLPQDDPQVRRPDITKAQKILDWQPRIGLEEGLKETIAYFRKVLGK